MTGLGFSARVRSFASLRGIFIAGFLMHVAFGSLLVLRHIGHPGASLYTLNFGIGPLVQNLAVHGTYASSGLFPDPAMTFMANRMPFVPLFLAGIAKVTPALWFGLVVKNLLFGGLLGVVLYRVIRRDRDWFTMAAVAFLLTMPQLIKRYYDLQTEENYTTQMIAFLFAALIWLRESAFTRKRVAGIALLNGLLCLTKSSMLPVAIVFSVLYGARTRRWRVFSWFAVTLTAMMLGWGVFTLGHSGRFRISTSWDGWNLYKGNNAATLSLYPRYNLDYLDHDGATRPRREFSNEWELDHYYRTRAFDFIASHPGEEAELVAVKLGQFFLAVLPNVTVRGTARVQGLEKLAGVAYMVVFRLAFLVALALALRQLLRAKGHRIRDRAPETDVALAYLCVVLSYAAPYVIGFAYERHVTVMIIPTFLYLIWWRAWRSALVAPGSASTGHAL